MRGKAGQNSAFFNQGKQEQDSGIMIAAPKGPPPQQPSVNMNAN